MRGLLLMATVACGRLDFALLGDASTGAADDSAADASSSDAGTRICATWGPWGVPARATFLASNADDYASAVSADNRIVVFDSFRPGEGSWDLWQASRPDAASPFDTLVALAAINTSSSEENPALTPDGLRIYFSSDRTGTPRIYTATRSSVTQPFGMTTQLTGVLDTGPVCCPSISPDELTMYMFNPNVGIAQLEVATRPSTSVEFDTRTVLTALSGPTSNATPTVSADGLELYWGRNRTGNTVADIFVATRQSPTDPWGTPTVVPTLNATESETDPTLSYDGRTLWVQIFDHPLGNPGADIFFATRSCLD